jgi:hypothetical protein
MKKNQFTLLGMLAVLLTFALVLAGCSGKKDSGSSGDSGGTLSVMANLKEATEAAANQVKETAASKNSAPAASGKTAAEEDFTVELTKDNTVRITNYNGKEKNLVIPDTIQGLPVTEIGGITGKTNGSIGSGFTSVVIPEGVKVIREEAFIFGGIMSGSITSVALPNTLTTIGANAFGNNKLASIVIPDSVTTIGAGAFRNNKLTSVTLPAGLKRIPDQMFAYNDFTSFTVPEGITEIGGKAFNGCGKLTSITLPSTIQVIGSERVYTEALRGHGSTGSTFEGTVLTTVTIPDNVTKITWGGSDFVNCKNLSLATQTRLKQLGWNGQLAPAW